MKKTVRIIAVIGAIAVMALASACDEATVKVNDKPAETAAQTATEAATEAVTEAPTEAETETPEEETDAPAEETEAPEIADENSEKAGLVNSKWNLSKVIDSSGEEYAPQVYYGSMIRQTGAYIDFKDDDTFKCVMGSSGCEGTYTIENGVVLLHFTKVYHSFNKNETAGTDSHVVWDHVDTVTFDFGNVTNIFTRNN